MLQMEISRKESPGGSVIPQLLRFVADIPDAQASSADRARSQFARWTLGHMLILAMTLSAGLWALLFGMVSVLF